jgi:hypothetical protein
MIDGLSTGIINISSTSPYIINDRVNHFIIKGAEGKSKVTVYNLSGQSIKSPVWIESEFNLTLAKGTYILIIENNNQTYRQKIVVI